MIYSCSQSALTKTLGTWCSWQEHVITEGFCRFVRQRTDEINFRFRYSKISNIHDVRHSCAQSLFLVREKTEPGIRCTISLSRRPCMKSISGHIRSLSFHECPAKADQESWTLIHLLRFGARSRIMHGEECTYPSAITGSPHCSFTDSVTEPLVAPLELSPYLISSSSSRT